MALPLRRKPAEPPEVKWLDVSAAMTGSLSFKDPVNLQINGQFEGTLETRGQLAIGEQANVRATIRGETISVAGTVEGSITASGRLELLRTARVIGKVAAAVLVVQEGAVLHGTCEMLPAPLESASMSLEELARYLEVDGATILEWAQAGRLPGELEGDIWRFERRRVDEWIVQEKIRE